MKDKLTDQDKKLFEKRATSITDIDELRIRDEASREIEKLKHLAKTTKKTAKFYDLIENAQLFYDMVNDEDFHLPISSRKWISFGLDYLISPYDLIPDAIPGIGYSDDAIVLSWVKYLVANDIKRYNSYKKALNLQETGGQLKLLKEGANGHQIIVILGILGKVDHAEYRALLSSQIETVYPDSSILIFHWNEMEASEMENCIRNLDHQLPLKVSYDTDNLQMEWNDAKNHTEIFTKTFLKDLNNLTDSKECQKISLICNSLGVRLFVNCLDDVSEGFIDDVYFMAGATNNRKAIIRNSFKINKIHNFYFDHDFVLKFLFENFENGDKPIGLQPITTEYYENISDINCNKMVNRHTEFIEKLSQILQ